MLITITDQLGRRMTDQKRQRQGMMEGRRRLVLTGACALALFTVPAYGPSAATLVTSTLETIATGTSSRSPSPAALSPAGAVLARPHTGAVSAAVGPRQGVPWRDGKTLPIRLSTDKTAPVFRRDMASLEELGLVDGIATAEFPVLAEFGPMGARLKPFVGGSLAFTQSYADAGHNRLIVITDPDAVIRFQGTAGLSLVSGGASELQLFYRYIKFTDPGLRPSASLLALTDTLTSSQRQHEVMMGWRMKF